MRHLNDVLRGQPYVTGQDFSMADITLIGGLIFAALLKVSVPDECEALVAWYARMQGRPSVQNWRTL